MNVTGEILVSSQGREEFGAGVGRRCCRFGDMSCSGVSFDGSPDEAAMFVDKLMARKSPISKQAVATILFMVDTPYCEATEINVQRGGGIEEVGIG